MIPLALGPFGTETNVNFESLAQLIELDNGMEMEINGKPTFICSFIGAILGDMPNQQLLSGCLGPRANRSCRYCLTLKDELSNLEYDIVKFGRYGEQMRRDFNRVRAIPSKVAQQKALKDLGLHDKWDLKDVLGMSNGVAQMESY